jgi:5-(carboxyamino)imidazole ribonucleotide synthase
MTKPLPPGSTIGILGGGQLGRMTAMAAARLGYRVHVFTPWKSDPCEQVSATATVAEFVDEQALTAFAHAVDAITLEFENVPAETLDVLAKLKPVRPSASVLRTAQDRLKEKHLCQRLGIAAAAYAPVDSQDALWAAVKKIGYPAVLKTTRLGYDGKGQWMVRDVDDAAAAWQALAGRPALLEALVDFSLELSVIVARGQDGATIAYPAVENRHRRHILKTTIAPAAVSPAIAQEAKRIALTCAERLHVVGLLAVEMFVTKDGDVLLNEIAPRPHNSGHWTIEGCPTSQFEQLVRAVVGLPLGPVEPFVPAEMENLIGDEALAWREIAADPTAYLHLYGKDEIRAGRKMGHVTRLRRTAA